MVILSRALDRDRKSTRLNSSHLVISYAVFCLKKKKHLVELTQKQNNRKYSEQQQWKEKQDMIPHSTCFGCFTVPRFCLRLRFVFFFFFNDTATTEIYTLSLHDALPISIINPRPRTSPTILKFLVQSA